MVHVVKGTADAQRKHSSDIEQCLDSCKEKFNQILSGVLNKGNNVILDITPCYLFDIIHAVNKGFRMFHVGFNSCRAAV